MKLLYYIFFIIIAPILIVLSAYYLLVGFILFVASLFVPFTLNFQTIIFCMAGWQLIRFAYHPQVTFYEWNIYINNLKKAYNDLVKNG